MNIHRNADGVITLWPSQCVINIYFTIISSSKKLAGCHFKFWYQGVILLSKPVINHIHAGNSVKVHHLAALYAISSSDAAHSANRQHFLKGEAIMR